MECSRDSDAHFPPTQTRAQRHALYRKTASWQLCRRPAELGADAGSVRVFLFPCRLACVDDRLRRHFEAETEFARSPSRLAGGWARSQALDLVHPVAYPAACRTSPAVLDDYAARLAGAGADVQRTAGEHHRQRPDHVRISGLPGAAGSRHPDLQGRLRPGGRRPGPARRADPRNRAAI